MPRTDKMARPPVECYHCKHWLYRGGVLYEYPDGTIRRLHSHCREALLRKEVPHDPNSYPGPACWGGPSDRCDGLGILPFELPRGRTVLLCRLHHYQWKINTSICESQECNNQARHFYSSKTCVEGKYLCDCCFTRQMLLQALDLALLEQSQGGAA